MSTRYRSGFKALFAILIFAAAFIDLRAQTPNPESLKLTVNTGHSNTVLAVAISSDGRLAVTGSVDGTAILWDIETAKQLRSFVGHESTVSAVDISSDGQFVLTASWDGTARLWETSTGRQVRSFSENRNGLLIKHAGKIFSADISADGRLVVTAGEDKTARVWDFKTGKQLNVLEHPARVNAVAFSPDGAHVLTGGDDRIARLFAMPFGELERQLTGHTGEIRSVAYSLDGEQFLTGSTGLAFLWDARTGAPIRKFDDMVGLITDHVAISKSGGRIYAGGSTFDSVSGKRVGGFGYTGYSAAITPDGTKLLASYTDNLLLSNYAPVCDLQRPIAKNPGDVFVFDIQTGEEIKRLAGRSDTVNDVAVASGHGSIFTAGASATSSLWKLATGQRSAIVTGDRSPAESFSAAFSSDGKWLVTKEPDYVVLREASTGKFLQQPNDYGCWNRDVAVSPDSRFILAKQNNSFLVKLDPATMTPLQTFLLDWRKILGEPPSGEESYRENYITTFALSTDGKFVAIATESRVGVWTSDLAAGSRPVFMQSIRGVQALAFSQDGKAIATASANSADISKIGIGNAASANGVALWDVASGRAIDGFGGSFGIAANKFTGYRSLVYSPDGKFIAAGSFDGTVYLRNIRTRQLQKLEGHTAAVNSVRFALDANGKQIVISASSDSTTRIWDVAAAKEICTLVTFFDGNWAVVESRTGRYDAPNGGEIEGIQWVYGIETIALSQLKDVFYTPNLLPRLLGYNNEPLRAVPDLRSMRLFPKIVEQSVDEATGKLTVKLRNRGGGIGEVRVLVNGKLATDDARTATQRANPNAAEAVVTFDLTGSAGFDREGKNTVEVISNNTDPQTRKGYISSRADTLVIGGGKERPVKQPKLFAVIAGVSDYNGDRLDLRFAAKDAEDFANALGIGARRLFCPKSNPECSDKVSIRLLTTSGRAGTMLPTKANIKAAFAAIAKEAGPDDVLVVYLAGHGVSLTLDGADTYLFLSQEADNASRSVLEIKDYREAATISSTELLQWITQETWIAGRKGIRALKQVMILDTCASGAFEQKVSLQKPRELSADQIRALQRLRDRTGLHILMGSAADAVSYEASQYGQGLMTYSLLQGMKGAALKNQRSVETQTLFDYAANEVPKMAAGIGGIQKPRVFGATSIPIGLMEDADKEKIKLESVKPIMLRPNLVLAGETGADILGLNSEFRLLLDEASEPKSRGAGTSMSVPLVYIDDDGFPGGWRVTGTYTVGNDRAIKLKGFLWKNVTTPIPLPEILAGTPAEAARGLLEQVLKAL